MPEKKPYISVIIPVYHDWESLDRALDALGRQTWPKNRFEIIVVNNDPADDFPAKYPNQNLRMACEGKAGSYAARNKGIRISRGDILGFCDADCIPCPCWLEKAVRFLSNNPGYSRVAGKIELVYGDSEKRSYAELYESIFAFRQAWYAKNGTSTTANMFVQRDIFDDVGMFNEGLLSGGDLEWGQRALKAGYPIGYSKNALVRHPARKNIRELTEKAKRVCSGYILINQADIIENPLNALYHGFSMIKPPIEAGRMIFARKDIPMQDRIILYLLEYLLKIVQFKEYIRCQMKRSN